MTKLTLNNITNLENQGSVVASINNNNDLIESSVENTLSRDGTSPNQMTSQLDMNSNRIINLPTVVSTSSGDAVSLGQLNASAIRYDIHQSLTPIQQQQARDNINVSGGGGGGGPSVVTGVFGRVGDITATTGDYTVAQVTGAAPLASPALTGVPTVPTASVGNNTTQAASTAFVIANAGAGLVSSVFGRVGAITATTGDYTAGQITNTPTGGIAATTIQSAINELDSEKANIASPTFTGSPMAPTPSPGDNDTSVATTAFVDTSFVKTPATNTANSVPQWNGANSKTLKDGLVVGTSANNLVQLNGSSQLPAVDGSLLTGIAGNPFTTGDVKITFKITADSGWILCDDGSIGNGSSGGTTRANADTSALFTLLYNNITALVVQDNTGTPVGRGANAAADFAANRRLVIPKTLGRALAIAGAGSGLTSRTIGSTAGLETETPTIAKTAAHSHTIGYLGIYDGTGSQNAIFDGSAGANTGTVGSGTALNIMQPTTFLNIMIKL